MRNLILIVFILPVISGSALFAQQVKPGDVMLVAKNAFYQKSCSFNERPYASLQVESLISEKNHDGTPLYYICNIRDGGYIAVAGLYSSVPVLFYSMDGKYAPGLENPAFKFWTQQYCDQLEDVLENPVAPEKSTSHAWDFYINADESVLKAAREKAIQPLITTTWNQGIYYNELCPADAAGPGGHVYAGCVATAMGQVMFYHKWPPMGTGNFSYYHDDYGTISADFGSTTYNWDAMLTNLQEPNYNIALLLHHLGVSVTMDYGPNGSGMWNHSAAWSLQTFFKYCPETEYVFRDSTTLDWDSILVANLDAFKPMYYAGWADDTSYTSGHAFVCDGYQAPGYYHFNWGWGGSYDGFFYTNNLTPGGSQFTHVQEVIKDSYPDTVNYLYPSGCTGTKTLSYSSGTINDGSYAKFYEGNLDCGYLIEPECGSILKMIFESFELGTGDSLYVYDGNGTSGNLLTTLSSSNIPVIESDEFLSENGNIFLRFVTDAADQYTGWDISYETVFCEGIDTLTDASGTVADGSDTCDYHTAQNCKWVIQLAGADSIYLNFTQFEVAPNTYTDLVAVYKNSITAGNLLAKFDASHPPYPMIIPAGTCILFFKTGTAAVAGGWEAEYQANPTGIFVQESGRETMNIWPNPFTDDAMIEITITGRAGATVKISDATGRVLGIRDLSGTQENYKFMLGELAKISAQGIYFIELRTGNGIVRRKVVCAGN